MLKTTILNYKEDLTDTSDEDKKVELTGKEVRTMLSMIEVFIEEMRANRADRVQFNPGDITRAIQDGIEISSGKRVTQKVFTKDSIPMDDILETPAVFFSNKVSTAIFDDVKKGKVTLCPFGAVRFKTILRYTSPSQKGKIITQSMAVVWSKRQAEFLREHTDFNIRFFEKSSQSKNLSSDFLEKVVECYLLVKSMTDYEVQQKLLELDIKIEDDNFIELRKKLAYKLAENHTSISDLIQNKVTEDLNEAMQMSMTRDELNKAPSLQNVY